MVFGILLLVGGGLVAGLMLSYVIWQDDAIRHFVATDAEVLSSEVTVHRGSKSTTYKPEVEYHYTFGGAPYDSHQLTPYTESGGSKWAYRLARRFTVGATVTAYVNLRNPAEAILVREYSSTPYFVTCCAIWAAAIGAGMLFRFVGGGRVTMQAVPLDPAGWQLLLPAKSMKRALRDAWLTFLATGLPMGALLGHLAVVGSGFEVFTWILLVVAALVIVWEIITLYRAWSVSRHMSDPRVMVMPAPLRIGEPFGMRVEFDAYSPLRVEKVRARVICIEHYRETRGGKTQAGTRPRGEKAMEFGGGSDVSAGQLFSGEGQVVLSRSEQMVSGKDRWPASSEGKGNKFPYFTWELRLEVSLLKRVDYGGVFPLQAV